MKALWIGTAICAIVSGALALKALLPSSSVQRAIPPQGTILIQLGTYDSQEEAKRFMALLRRDTESSVRTMTEYLVEVHTDDRVYWRLQAWPLPNLEYARALCDHLMMEQLLPCVPIIQRD